MDNGQEDLAQEATDTTKKVAQQGVDTAKSTKKSSDKSKNKGKEVLQEGEDKVSQQGGKAAQNVKEEMKETSERGTEKAKELTQNVKDNAGPAAEKVKKNSKEIGQQVSDNAGPAMDQAKDIAQNAGQQAKEKAGPAYDQAKQSAKEYGQQAKEKAGPAYDQAKQSAKEFGQQAKEKAGPAAQQAKESAKTLGSQAKDKAGQVWDAAQTPEGQEKMKKGLDRAQDVAGKYFENKAQSGKDGQGGEGEGEPPKGQQMGTSAGQFLKAMASDQGLGLGEQIQQASEGTKELLDTANQVWEEKVSDEVKSTITAGARKVTATTERLWDKFFHLMERGLDYADHHLFSEDEDNHGDEETGDAVANPDESGPLLARHARKRAPLKPASVGWGMTKWLWYTLGTIVLVLLLTLIMFFLGIFMLPILLVVLVLLLVWFQCYACCCSSRN